ncbi:hypothetical protein FHR34_002870 [Kitasatospora kifunensis]|uniref:Uncharacterized protein n=1 Tax=Kitasatospora kifunensis TaxID=58351 RepID=A0A7W7VUZ9_KITKI|nr:hypothetical protein [Kitasatospora kifunensis]
MTNVTDISDIFHCSTTHPYGSVEMFPRSTPREEYVP